MNKKHLVILSGAGISKESGIDTFRDKDGLWKKHDALKLASIEGWNADPQASIAHRPTASSFCLSHHTKKPCVATSSPTCLDICPLSLSVQTSPHHLAPSICSTRWACSPVPLVSIFVTPTPTTLPTLATSINGYSVTTSASARTLGFMVVCRCRLLIFLIQTGFVYELYVIFSIFVM